MSYFSEKLEEELRGFVADLMEIVEDGPEFNFVEREIFVPDEDDGVKGTIHRELNSEYSLIESPYAELEEAAHWLFETDAINNRDHKYYDDFDNEDELITDYQRVIWTLTIQTINYSGSFEFEESAFQKALQGDFAQYFGRERNEIILVPLENFDCSLASFEFNHNLNFGNAYRDNRLESIEIKRASDIELASIYTAERDDHVRDFPRYSNWSYLLKIEISGPWGGELGDDVRERIISLFRLLHPSMPDIKPGPFYAFTERVLNDRYGIYDWIAVGSVGYDIGFSTETHRLDEDQIDELVIFWENHRDKLHIGDVDSLKTPLSEPLRRLNYAFERSITEDRVLDCVIALEGSLAKDLGGGYQVYFPFRAATILVNDDTYDSEYIYEFFSKLWTIRNEIVHNTGTVPEVEIGDETLHANEFGVLARTFLANILVEYAQYSNDDYNITQTNQQLLDPVLPKLIGRLSDAPHSS